MTRADVLWHYRHMLDPRATSPGSNMPAYPWLLTASIDTESTGKKLKVMQRLGVPYSDAEVHGAKAAYATQADAIVAGLATQGASAPADSKLVALIGYLMRLGKNQVPVGTASSR